MAFARAFIDRLSRRHRSDKVRPPRNGLDGLGFAEIETARYYQFVRALAVDVVASRSELSMPARRASHPPQTLGRTARAPGR